MCGRYASARSVEDLAEAFGIGVHDVDSVAEADWNIAPTKPVTAVLVTDNHRRLTTLRWGLVPAWSIDPTVGARMINARIETVADKPAFRDALAARRCLLPADGWYEWAVQPGGIRQPYYLTPPDGRVIAFAGLWEIWRDAEGRLLHSATILTGPAPDDLSHVHDRSPVVLAAADWAAWLDPDTTDVRRLLRPTGAGVVAARPVGLAVGDVRNNAPTLTDAVELTEQPPLF
ncbi:MAG: hypothetical protein QOF18_1419 [Frankiaceae bacterium]|jgi:putative SOS response-associated peptidase YedK|nr:hypothetical protein [Frankiaceae bacterium]